MIRKKIKEDNDFKKFFSGKELYGDDFTLEQIKQWFKEEEEAYANIYGEKINSDNFDYSIFDKTFFFSKIPDKEYSKVLGLGASWGYEFLPIIHKIKDLFIIESSEQTKSHKLGNIKPKYFKPNMSGKINDIDNTYDLITAFSVLHHIPNVSFVVAELYRVLNSGGYLLIREPINSMEDWRNHRIGLTKNERGIPKDYLHNMISLLSCEIVSISYHYFMYSYLNRKFSNARFLKSKTYLMIDKILSKIFLFNYHYHPQKKIERIAPMYVSYIIKKP